MGAEIFDQWAIPRQCQSPRAARGHEESNFIFDFEGSRLGKPFWRYVSIVLHQLSKTPMLARLSGI
jgi:hypothetical protein